MIERRSRSWICTTTGERWIIGCASRQSKGSKPWSFFGNSFILMIQIPRDFQEFLRLLNDQKIEYLIIGGYAVGHYGYVR